MSEKSKLRQELDVQSQMKFVQFWKEFESMFNIDQTIAFTIFKVGFLYGAVEGGHHALMAFDDTQD